LFRTPEDRERADWPLLEFGAVTLFWRGALFDATKAQLGGLGYRLIEIDCRTAEQVVQEVSDGLSWAEQFGYEPWTGNLNALDDAFHTFPFGSDDDVAICVRGFHVLVHQDERLARGLLDAIERWSRHHLLSGRRLLAVIQTNDAEFYCEGLGAGRANWNNAEWFNASRGLQEP